MEVFIKVTNGLVMYLEENAKRVFVLLYYVSNFSPFWKTRCEDIDEVDNGVICIKENLVGSMLYNLIVVRIKLRQNQRSAFRQHKHFF